MREKLKHVEKDIREYGLKTSEEANKLVEKFLDDIQSKENESESFYRTLDYQLTSLLKYVRYKLGHKESRSFSSYRFSENHWKHKFGKEIKMIGYPTIDHLRSGKGKIVSHPYDSDKNQLTELIELTDKFDVDFWLDGKSEYRPGYSFRIIFKKGARNE